MKSVRNVLLAVLVFTILTSGVTAWGLWCYCNPIDEDPPGCKGPECGSGNPCCGCGTVSSDCKCCYEPCRYCSSVSGPGIKHGEATCVEPP